MGLAVLPGRLKTELDLIKMVLLKTTDIESHESLEKHRPWIEQIQEKYIDFSDVDQLLRDEVGLVFEKVLEDCGVFKSQDLDEFVRFLEKSAI
jgi:UDPglucose--hexose-1-phosphate uridylyltransferase